jgi:tetratricopeptide (TPR) repeat protein
MPTVINGTGTWYYGRRRIYRRKGVCGFCNRLAELESYDTTLYVVFFFIPLVPLGQKRILDGCPQCRRHRALPRKTWEASKAADIDRLLEKLRENPDDRDAIVSGLGLAAAYQDPVLFDKLAYTLATDRLDDAVIQAQLGAVYAHFARHTEAAEAYRAALAIEDSPAVRRQLALTLLKQGRPREALPYLRHILDERLGDHAGLLYFLVEGFQAEGLHQEALDLMDERDAAFPNLAATQACVKQRQTSERYLPSGTKVRSAYLSASPGAGYREGSWTAYLPRIIAPLIVVGLLAWYLGAALWIGRARQVYLVNGSDAPYTVAVNGRERRLRPGAATPVELPEGEVMVEFREPGPGREPVHCRVETPFWSRPFLRRMFVVNPDRVAVLIREQAEYAEKPGQVDPPQAHLGEPLYAFDSVDCPFTPLPQTVEVEEGHRVVKTRVGLVPGITSEGRLRAALQALDRPRQLAYARRLVDLNPNDAVALQWLVGQLGEAEGLALLRSRLDTRPVLVEWHRAYQTMMERLHPEEDLRPAYRKLAEETGQRPDALYLLARLTQLDPDEADRLLRQAAAADPPSAHAQHALGYAALVQGQFADAVRWTGRAVELAPDSVTVQDGYRKALLAAGQYDPLLEQLRLQQGRPGQKMEALVDMVRVYGVKGDEAPARAVIAQALALAPADDPAARQGLEASLEVVLCCTRGDTAGFLERAPQVPGLSHFEPAVLRGNLREAAGLVDDNADRALVQRAVLYLAALKAGDGKLADEQWPLLLAGLDKGHGALTQLGEVLAGRKKPDVARIRRLSIQPDQKRALLAVVARRYPETAKELLPLARQLDYAPDPTSLCLRELLE